MGVGFTGSCAMAYKTSATLAADTESSPEVGSSSNKTSGSAMSSNPMVTLLISPPLIPLALPPVTSPILASLTCAIPSFWSISLTRSFFSWSLTLSGRRRRAANRTASKTVNVAGRTSCWATKPIRGGCFLSDRSEVRSIRPDTIPALFFPARISTSVVFPAPK